MAGPAADYPHRAHCSVGVPSPTISSVGARRAAHAQVQEGSRGLESEPRVVYDLIGDLVLGDEGDDPHLCTGRARMGGLAL
jgi:hypothetical protein